MLYAGTFSKVLSPGMRVGYAIGPAALLKKMIVCKQGEDVHTGISAQMICRRIHERLPIIEAHLDKLRAIYRHKGRADADRADRPSIWYPPASLIDPIQGGLFMWCRAAGGGGYAPLSAPEAVKEHKVAVVPGNAFLVE